MKIKLPLLFPLVLVLFLISSRSFASSNDDCLACHSDSTMTMQRNGKTVSLFVSGSHFNASVHGQAGIACTDCHQGFSADDVPHKQKTPNVNCDECHDVQLQAPKGAKYHLAHSTVKCWTCHGSHYIEPASKIVVDAKCISCHPAQRSFLNSPHAKAMIGHEHFTCVTCHGKAHGV